MNGNENSISWQEYKDADEECVLLQLIFVSDYFIDILQNIRNIFIFI